MSYNPPNNSSGPAVTVTPTGSPFTYTAPSNGAILLNGGTLSTMQYKRGSTTSLLGLGTSQIVVAAGDQVTFSYLTPPTITFIPF